MPELPEVETVVRDLRPLLRDARIESVRVGRRALRHPWAASWKKALVGSQVQEVRRRGKWICIVLDGDRCLIVHLGMTGQLFVLAAAEPVQDHTHVILGLSDDRHLRYRDIRRFGSVQLFSDPAAVQRLLHDGKLGPEPWDLQAADWRERLTATERCLKAALLDQKLVAGVGNIYADESLWEARLPPYQLGSATSAAQANRLRQCIVKVLERAIERRGSSIQNYVGGSGLKGEYQNEFRAYGRTGEPCRRCKTPITRVRLAGRSTHYCPKCQVQSSKLKTRNSER